MGNIVNRILDGISKAQKHYETWTGGYWLWEAPEYVVTTYIARHISKINDRPFYLTLENNVRNAIDAAGGLPPGRPREAPDFDGLFR